MIVSYKWLKEISNITVSSSEFQEGIIMNGMEIEEVIETGVGKQDIVVCEIQSIVKHEKADNLYVTVVDCGKFGKKNIVTNLSGLTEGDKLLVALEGVELTGGFKIKSTELKGVKSEGMFIGWENIGFKIKSPDPIYVENEIKNGTLYTDIGEFNDDSIDIELTANRGDCLGMIGMARETAARFDGELQIPAVTYKTSNESVEGIVSVKIDTPDCKRYCGAVIKNVKIGPSPLWMQLKLAKLGIRPINNIVDITNYVLMEFNQPLHAFDLDKIEQKKIIIRKANKSEKLVTLDDIERELEENDIVIASLEKGHCLGGVMGGSESEVTKNTKNIFLEAAFFNPVSIRKTSRRLGLRSDSSYRFEREIDRDNVINGLKRALSLFDKLSIGSIADGLIDEYPMKKEVITVDVGLDWVNEKLGTSLNADEITGLLEKIGFKVEISGEKMIVTVPSWRNDVSIREDIAEEVGRLYGYNNIKPTNFPSQHAAVRTDEQLKQRAVTDIMCQSGALEVFNFSLIGKSLLDSMHLPEDHKYRDIIHLETPLTDDWASMRNSLIPGLLKTASFNITHGNKNFSIFEHANVSVKSGDILPDEKQFLGVVISGNRVLKSSLDDIQKYDFYDIKGIFEEIVDFFRVKMELKRSDEVFLHPFQQAEVVIDGKSAGVFGKLHPEVMNSFNIDVDLYVGEINTSIIFDKSDRILKAKEISRFPSSDRDMAIVVEKKVEWRAIDKAIRSAGTKYLSDFKIIDIYSDQSLGENYHSIAINFTFTKEESTLKDKEVDNDFDAIFKSISESTGAKLRG